MKEVHGAVVLACIGVAFQALACNAILENQDGFLSGDAGPVDGVFDRKFDRQVDVGGDIGTDVDGIDGSCGRDDQCAFLVSMVEPFPPNCAEPYCDTDTRRCALRSVDSDGDGHRTSRCFVPQFPFAVGDDCDDDNPSLFPSHAADCSEGKDGVLISWPTGRPEGNCQFGTKTCNPDGTASACMGAIAPALRDCTSNEDNDCDSTPDRSECDCAPPTTRCSGNGVQSCDRQGNWSAAQLCADRACVAGACQGVCAPSQTRCSGNAVQTCSADGQWGPAVACVDQTCVLGAGATAACQGACAPERVRCSDNGVQTCTPTGTWSAPVLCVNSTCSSGACSGPCAPGQSQCSGNGIQTCQNGQWGTPAACVRQTCLSTSSPNDAGVGDGGTPVSDGGRSGDAGASGTACVGVCAPGQTKCEGNGVRACNEKTGTWAPAVACLNQTCLVNAGVCSGECAPGQTQCAGNGVQACSANGTWGAVVQCAHQTCLPATGVASSCNGVCAPEEKRCSGNGVQTCQGGEWSAPTACVNQACAEGSCIGECTPGAGDDSCNSGVYQCGGTRTCNSAGEWGACSPANCVEFGLGVSPRWDCSNLCSGASCDFQFSATCPPGTSRTRCNPICVSGCCFNSPSCGQAPTWNDPSNATNATCSLHIGTRGCDGATMQVEPFCQGPH